MRREVKFNLQPSNIKLTPASLQVQYSTFRTYIESLFKIHTCKDQFTWGFTCLYLTDYIGIPSY